MTKLKPFWATVLLALAAAAVAFVASYLSGCSVAVHGQLVGWGAFVDKEPPPVPEWASRLTNDRKRPTTRPNVKPSN